MQNVSKHDRSVVALVVSVLSFVTPAIIINTSDGDVAAQTASSCLVSTTHGQVQGLLRGGTCTYFGVPYAAAPMGDLRWRPPQPRAPWAPMTLNVTAQGPTCAQINLAGAVAGVEDCLTLNIWAPRSVEGRDLPVLVWLHTGGFQAASANLAASDGRRFAEERDAIVVAPNYRLGPFGFLAHRALTEEDATYASSGNYGLADQRAALGWVRQNIARFGGNPDNVTLAGTSAGAGSTSVHLVSPASRGLFQRAIMQSGHASARINTMADAEAQGTAFATALGCTDLARVTACMRSKSISEVLTALPLAGLTGGVQTFTEQPGRVAWGPVVDGREIPDQPRELYRRGLFSRVPIIIGSNRDDGWTFVDRSFPAGLDELQYERAVRTEFGMDADAILRMYPVTSFPSPKDALGRLTTDVEYVCEVRRIARVMHHDGAPVFVYSFDYTVDQVTPGRAFHGLESNLVFGNNFGAPSNHLLTRDDLILFDTISTFWRQFMENGDPNPRGTPTQWPPYRPTSFESGIDPSRSDHHFVFDRRIGVANYLRDAPCNFWESFYFRSTVSAAPASAR